MCWTGIYSREHGSVWGPSRCSHNVLTVVGGWLCTLCPAGLTCRDVVGVASASWETGPVRGRRSRTGRWDRRAGDRWIYKTSFGAMDVLESRRGGDSLGGNSRSDRVLTFRTPSAFLQPFKPPGHNANPNHDMCTQPPPDHGQHIVRTARWPPDRSVFPRIDSS